ncbi:hypothetical protein CLG85_016570 [Yangia mangrovi]|uniref:Cytochrome c domain-containing protein n=1 Tax=Alloyangia mangrovi TaxID=1779329 RepID=A0A2A3JX76_9RHOB|nr:hypothetical protein [Alloyangia mangrovi]MCT4371844.1 hypothetical protein [Alloyangia mangrovi]
MHAFLSCRGGAALVLCSLIASPGAAADPSTGAQAWTANCAKCHRDPARIASAIPVPNDTAGAARLDRFLADHHARDASTRAAIISWLQDQASQ